MKHHRALEYVKLITLVIVIWSLYIVYLASLPTPQQAFLKTHTISLEMLQVAVKTENAYIVNANIRRFSESLTNPIAIILVQVRRKEAMLKRLLASLQQVDHISTAIVVLSHATYDNTINGHARTVRFCQLIQLYYPYSVQLHPNRFPGPSARDCGMPDSSPDDCSPRNAHIAEAKHQWWWTMNYVFKRIPAAMGGAPVILLEDDHVVAPDLLHMVRFAERALTHCPTAHVASLGRAPTEKAEDPAQLAIDMWRPTYVHGLMLNITVWKRIANLATRYCMFDDSNWSQSLLNVFAGFPRGHVDVVTVKEPRVLVGPLSEWRRWDRTRLFPQRVRTLDLWARGKRLSRWAPKVLAAAGGWEDLRDQLFCLDPQIDISDYDITESDATSDASSFNESAIN